MKESSTMIGAAIRSARKQRNMNATQLGKSLNPPVTAGAVSAWETGRNIPNSETVRQICEVLGVDASSFFKQDGAGYDPIEFPDSIRSGVIEFGDCYAKMNDQQRDAVLTVVRSMVS